MDAKIAKELIRSQADNNRNTIIAIGLITAVGGVVLMKLGPSLLAPNVANIKNALTQTTNTITSTVTNTVNSATGTKTTTKTTSKGVKAGSKKKRPVYLVSDNIYGKSKDLANLNTIAKNLRKKGLKVVVYGIGPDKKNAVLKSKAPANALIADIAGGACAGTILEKGMSYYKKWKGSRKVVCIWIHGTNINGLKWLPRAHDDNFSNIAGITRPDLYLKKHGYPFLYSKNLGTVSNWIYQQATS